MTADRTCDLAPFTSPVVAQIATLDQAASAVEILVQSLENFLARFKLAVCEDLTQIVEECCNQDPDEISFLDLTDTPDTYAGSAGRAVAVNAGATGLEFVDFPEVPENSDIRKWISYQFAVVAGTPVVTVGNSGQAGQAGTASLPALGTATASQEIYKIQLATANAANAIAHGWSLSLTQIVSMSTVGRYAGFRYQAVVGQGSAVTNQRAFWGFRGATGNPTSVNPSGIANIIGFGYDSGDTNIQVLRNGAIATGTKIDTGFPIAADEMYELTLTSEPGSGEVNYRIVRIDTGDEFSGTISTELPTVFLCTNHWVGTGGTAGVAELLVHHAYLSYF